MVEPILPLATQFERETVERIRAVQRALLELPPYEGPTRFYALELAKALEAGLLLSALQLSCTFLESYVRELVIEHFAGLYAVSSQMQYANAIGQLESILEDSSYPEWTFARMVDTLRAARILSGSDHNDLIELYVDVRTPLLHGLTRRLVRGERETPEEIHAGSTLQRRWEHRSERARQLEQLVEEKGVALVEYIVSFVEKYSDSFAP